jgi:predicted HTH domain antitoxin
MNDETADALVKLLQTEVRGLHERVNLYAEKLAAVAEESRLNQLRLNQFELKLDRWIEKLSDHRDEIRREYLALTRSLFPKASRKPRRAASIKFQSGDFRRAS